MSAQPDPACPRCAALLRPPSALATGWHCAEHGEVCPLWPALSPSPAGLARLLSSAAVPVWLPWPLPPDWLVTGFAVAGDERTGTQGCAVALAGPGPQAGLAELVLVSERPRVGLGARLAGLDGPDPGGAFPAGPPAAAVSYRRHELPLWQVNAPDADGRAAFAGEVKGTWLWLVLWPALAGLLLAQTLPVTDLRDPGQHLDLPFGAPSRRLPG